MSIEREVADVGYRLYQAIRYEMTREPVTSPDVLRRALAAATAMIVSYESAQRYIDELELCIDAKERVRAIEAGEVADVN